MGLSLQRSGTGLLVLCMLVLLHGCISPSNAVIEGLGTPDPTQCSSLPSVEDGALYAPREAVELGLDGRTHPDVFYAAWSKLDTRSDLRFPEDGYDSDGYEDKLLVSRKQADGKVRTWQLLPQLDNNCTDVEKIRIHSFDVAPNGRSLYVSMARTPLSGAGRDTHLGIYRYDLKTFALTKLSKDDATHFSYPTYIGNDPDTKHEMLVVSKTVAKDEIPVNYARKELMQDEYDRAPTPLIHKMDAQTGETIRIGFNNSHQTEPFVMTGHDGIRMAVFTQWEHQASVNRFALWKMQIDGSDEFTFFGQESSTDKSGANLFQGREVKSGAYKGYALMTQGNRSDKTFATEGDVVMTYRHHQELRSDKLKLQTVTKVGATDTEIARNPEHYNDQSFIYSYRYSSENTYQLYVKDFPADAKQPASTGQGEQLTPDTNDYHFVQARSFYPPERELVAPTDSQDLGENRVSFTNPYLNGKSGFLVQNLTQSDNGVQHQLDGVAPEDISLQFFLPSHHFGSSQTIGLQTSPEMSIPASDFIQPEADGSLGVVMKNGLYVWKVNKKFEHNGKDIWLPVRAERQEVNFVPNRVNACNQCHQERDQANIDKYATYNSIAAHKMRGNLTGVTDISDYDAAKDVPDFHRDIMPLLTKPAANGKSCASCHGAGTKLNLSNASGTEAMNATYRTLVQGAHKLADGRKIPYSNNSINPLGMDDNYQPAPLLWSLLLNNDLSVPEDATHPNDRSRSLERAGDYGATYDAAVEQTITDINTQYDHSQHWSAEDIQTFITYSATQMPAGLSDRIADNFTSKGTNYRSGAAGQKAYQALVRNCFSCHNSFTGAAGGGIEDLNFGLPLEKSFSNNTGLRDKRLRFMVHNHVAKKDDTAYSMYGWQSNLNTSMYETLLSATYRLDFNNPTESELLAYALGKDPQGNALTALTHHVKHQAVLDEGSADYLAIKNWAMGEWTGIINMPPQLEAVPEGAITIREYDPPAYLPNVIRWSDPDALNELSQIFLDGSSSNTHTFRDAMLALEYDSFDSARLKTYAILGDRGQQAFRFKVTDGQASSVSQTIPVTVTSDYVVPPPVSSLPPAYAFYTVRDTGGNPNAGQLRKLSYDPDNPALPKDTLIGTIAGYSNNWTTVYRRANKGWLYFVDQAAQQIHVVDETNAQVLFTITLDHEPNRETDMHKQTNYLIWWRPADGLDHTSANCPDGELQGLLESKLSNTKNGDFYIGLGCGDAAETVVPEYRTRLKDGANTLAVYTWKRATFMSKWVNDGVDRFNVLNLETGKDKALGDFDFPEQSVTLNDGGLLTYPAATYNNVRAVVVAEDGAFYGFNKDANEQPVTLFNFDPLQDIQQPVVTPEWVQTYFSNYVNYGTPFLVIEPRSHVVP